MPARSYTPPRDWVTERGAWPRGPFQDDAPPYAKAIAAMIPGLTDAIGDRSLRQVAALADMSHASLSRILNGETVPDTATLAALEYALGVPVWVSPAPAHR